MNFKINSKYKVFYIKSLGQKNVTSGENDKFGIRKL